jgi:membrane-associated protease RseP (regulator of RpoE activity)
MRTTFRGFVGQLLQPRWPGAGVAGLALLAVLAARGAAAAPVPAPKPDKNADAQREEPKKDEDRAPDGQAAPAVPVPRLPGTEEELRRLREAIRRQTDEELNRTLRALRRQALLLPDPAGRAGQGRLGVTATAPGDTLAEQLDLPRGQGLVLEEVRPDSAAAKAGLKAHDILLELNGKPVPDNPEEFARRLQEVKADTGVDVVVLRKGQRETIKGLKLPEAGDSLPAPVFAPPVPLNVVAAPLAAGAGGVLLTTLRTNDRFTTRYQEGSLVITVTGTVGDGKPKVSGIEVQDAGKTDRYESTDKVPARYRDKVTSLVEMTGRKGVWMQLRAP